MFDLFSEKITDPGQFETSSVDQYIYSVSELTSEIKTLLETTIPPVWIKGEVSNFTHHSSGHMYFSLKDENAQISCVMWRNWNQSLAIKPKDGMLVQAKGKVTVYEKRGSYQFNVELLQPAGIGSLQIAFEQLKQRLLKEGLFEATHKQPLPDYPERIGIVTSPTGAAIRDFVTVLHRRFPAVEIILRPVRVQGSGAAEEIANAIREFNEFGQVDLLIVGRGGGSLEDLWAFNEEIVAREIFRSSIPVVSAVGHEVDYTIADFVADLRAPTPSAAAEMVVRDRQDLLSQINQHASKLHRRLQEQIGMERQKLTAFESSYGFRRPQDLLLQYQQRLDEHRKSFEISLSHKIAFSRATYNQLWRRFRSLGPHSVLSRGYSICWRPTDTSIIRNSSEISAGETIAVQLATGGIRSKVTEIHNNEQLISTPSKSM